MTNPFAQAFQYLGQGDLTSAAQLCETGISSEPNNADGLHLYAIILAQSNQVEESKIYVEKAIELNPNNPHYYNTSGNILSALGQKEDAIAQLKKCIELSPQPSAEVYNNLGVVLKELGHKEEALPCFIKAIETNPNFAKAYLNSAELLEDQDGSTRAIEYYQRGIALNPQDPDVPLALNNLGILYRKNRSFESAMTVFQELLKLKPNDFKAWRQLATCIYETGDYDGAINEFQTLLKQHSSNGVRIELACLFPHIEMSEESIEQSRQRFFDNLKQLLLDGITLEHPEKELPNFPFFQGYHGKNNREMMETLAAFYEQVCPSLRYTAPHCKQARKNKDKLRIGFVSNHLTDNSVISKAFYPLIQQLKTRDDVEVIIFTENAPDPNQNVNTFPVDLEKAYQIIAEQEPDILIYLNIGMDMLSYFLAFARLAPVQCVTGGHPITSGIGNLDYYISHKAIEPKDAQDHYSEKLILLDNNPVLYTTPHFPTDNKTRTQLGLPEQGNLYTIPVLLFKIHPDCDAVIKNILERDENGHLLLFQPETKTLWQELLQSRFNSTIPKNLHNRIHFLPWAPGDTFFHILQNADAILDPFHFSMSTTALQILAAGLPFVTMPGEFMRGRAGYSFYRRMGIDDLIANSPEEYAQLALKLANDKDFRNKIAVKIKAKSHILFEGTAIADELAAFFKSA